MENQKTYLQLIDELNATRFELEEVRFKLDEASEIIEAIRSGEIDALVVKTDDGHQLYTLKSSDQTYRIFIEQMAEGAVTLNREMHIVYSNSRFAALVGLPLEKVIGQPFCRFLTPVFEQYCPELISQAWERDIKGELMLFNTTGKQSPVLLSLKTLDLDEGLSMSIIITDLSEQKETQQLLLQKNEQLQDAQIAAHNLNINLEKTVKERTQELEINIQDKTRIAQDLRSNQQRLTRILETMAEGVGIVDLDGNLTYANPLAKKILGLDQDSKTTVNFYTSQWRNLRLNGDPLLQDEHPLNTAILTGKPVYDHEIAIQSPDEVRYVSVNAAPLYNDEGHITGGIGTFMDVTNRRMQQQQKDDFISIASHELKTPITSLKASLQLLNRLKGDPFAKMLPTLIEQANKSMEKVSQLIADLLDVSHMNDGQIHLRKTKFVVSQLIDDCCSHIRSEGLHQIITNGELDLKVNADFEKIEQVVVNFVNNAAKYASKSKDICIDIARVGDMAKISVSDKGPGIAQESIPHLFDRYYRVDSNGIRYSGLGLGLYISAEIIKKHNGYIGVDSQLGQGSTFWFTIPL